MNDLNDLATYRIEHRYVGRGAVTDNWLLVTTTDDHDEAIRTADDWPTKWPGEMARVVTQHVIHRTRVGAKSAKS